MSNGITITRKEYRQLEERQRKLQEALAELRNIVLETYSDEIVETKAKRLEAISRMLDSGRGKRFYSFPSFKSYLRKL